MSEFKVDVTVTQTIVRTCAVCGQEFEVKMDYNTHKIISGGAYFGKVVFGIGDWACYELVGTGKLKRCIPWWKYLYLRLRDFKRKLLHQYKEVEYWECDKCFNRE